MEYGSILKVINTKASSEAENRLISKKHLEYVLRKEATADELVYLNMVDGTDVLGSFGYFAKAVGKNNGRPLKHIVISYSIKNAKRLCWEEYLSVTKEIAKFYGNNYQIVAAVHNNIEKRPHAHIILDCFNISTEKKFSESMNDLNLFKDFVDNILSNHNIPLLLRNKNNFNRNDKSMINSEDYQDEEYDMPVLPSFRTEIIPPQFYGYSNIPPAVGFNNVQQFYMPNPVIPPPNPVNSCQNAFPNVTHIGNTHPSISSNNVKYNETASIETRASDQKPSVPNNALQHDKVFHGTVLFGENNVCKNACGIIHDLDNNTISTVNTANLSNEAAKLYLTNIRRS